jgi:hypothetical protein
MMPQTLTKGYPVRMDGAAVTIIGGRDRTLAKVVEACPFDLLLRAEGQLSVGQAVCVVWKSNYSLDEVRIKGVVHWVQQARGLWETGVALQEGLPEELLFDESGVQRASIRYQCRVSGNVRFSPEGSHAPALILNYSRNGICFQSSISAGIGSPFYLRIDPAPFGQQKFPLNRCSQLEGVIRWTSGDDQSVLVGCELRSDLGYRLSGVTLRRDTPAYAC